MALVDADIKTFLVKLHKSFSIFNMDLPLVYPIIIDGSILNDKMHNASYLGDVILTNLSKALSFKSYHATSIVASDAEAQNSDHNAISKIETKKKSSFIQAPNTQTLNMSLMFSEGSFLPVMLDAYLSFAREDVGSVSFSYFSKDITFFDLRMSSYTTDLSRNSAIVSMRFLSPDIDNKNTKSNQDTKKAVKQKK